MPAGESSNRHRRIVICAGMTGTAPVLDRPALWAALSHMRIELPGGHGRFEDELARRSGWSVGFAERVTDEYCGFLYLPAVAGFEVTPSKAVDEAWHLHLTCPHYEDVLCGRILGRPLRHLPAVGAPGEEERHRRQYAGTVALYERTFGKAPPGDIWPRPIPEEEREEAARRRRGRRLAFGSAIGMLVAATAAQALDLVAIALVLGGGALIFLLLALPTHPSEARTRGGD